MNYRTMGPRVAEQVSALGFGCMRFPKTKDENPRIEREESARMLRYAIEQGVNYVDTAWPYHGGESEEFVGEVLEGALRKKILLATKMPVWEVKEPADLDRIFERQLEKLRTDYVDFYLLHAINEERRQSIIANKMIEWGEKQKRDGRIRYLGFSFHDEWPVFKALVDMYDQWDFCQIQYNYMNEKHQAGTRGLNYAADRDIGVVVMEPLLGGALANTPDAVQAVFADAETPRGSVEWALDWLWDKERVGTVLSGMSSMEQVEQNVAYAGRSRVGMLTDSERALFPRARKAYESLQPVPCTQCNYCMPCPHGVDIPGNFAIMNDYYKYADRDQAVARYNRFMPEEARATACIRCNECLPKCPQNIAIPDCLERVNEELAEAV
ncbi:MAG: aldo/keto reductase [Spirochaetota bacterium]